MAVSARICMFHPKFRRHPRADTAAAVSYTHLDVYKRQVYQFMDRKRAEGKPFRVYMMASANKFLRIYYATVKAYLESLEQV